MNSTKCETHASRPKLLTEPCGRFFDYYDYLTDFFVFFVRMARRPDEMLEDLQRLIYKLETDEAEKELVKKRLEDQELKPGDRHVVKFSGLLMETLLVRGTDNFLTYLSELLALVFTSRPETLKSSETVKLEEILQHPTMEELIHRLAERRVERLSYQGMKELQKDLSERLNFDLFPSSDLFSNAIRVIETRNLIVHNRGVVNHIFRVRTGDSTIEIGKQLRLGPPAVIADIDFLAKSVVDIDDRAATKFGLARAGA